MKDDSISRQAVLDKFEPWLKVKDYNDGELNMLKAILYEIRFMRSAQPEVKQISYTDCANAMLMMWMDKVLTDGEYNRIMDKLNEHEKKKGEDNE